MHSAAATAARAERAVSGVPVVRYARYTLVEVRPDAVQQDLLEQIIDIALSRAIETTVGDALRFVLARTGYQLCETDSDTNVLFALPLPAVHRQLGPMTLRDALQTLAGHAWTVDIDSVARRVCFLKKDTEEPSAEPRKRSRRSRSKDDGDRSSPRTIRG